MEYRKKIKGKVLFGEPLKEHTSFKVGGPARLFFLPRDAADLGRLLVLLKKEKVPFLVLGAGSNILAKDGPIKKAILCLDSPGFKKFAFTGKLLRAQAGVRLNFLVAESVKRGLSGLEGLAGIPGSLGGAITMNAGAWGSSIADSVEKIKVMDYNGRVKIIDKKQAGFSYRRSKLSKSIILEAVIRLKKTGKRAAQNKLKECLALRRATQDARYSSAGCVFKNPGKESAGRLIDLCGLKGKGRGGAVISLRHANFILNKDKAKAADVLYLMRLVKSAVKRKFGITLEPEIKIWS